MKRLYLHILAGVTAALTLAACAREEAELKVVSDYPTFTATIAGDGSRAFDTTWESGDKIGIYCGDNIANISHTHQGDGNFTVTDPNEQIVFTDNNTVHFKAYYPYGTPATSGTNKGKITFTSTNIDQAKQKDFDFLWAEADGSKADHDVKFEFTHRMCKISIVFINGDDTDVSTITDYTIGSLYLKGTFDPSNGTCAKSNSASTGSAKVDLKNFDVEPGVPVTPVIVFPQQLSSQTATLPITITTPQTSNTLTGSLVFKERTLVAGNNYQFVVKVTKTKLTTIEASIDEWTTEERGDSWEAW